MPPGQSKSQNPPSSVWEKINSGAVAARLTANFWPGVLFIVLMTLAAYWPVYSAGFIWDDDAYVTDNTLLSEPDGWWRIWFSAHFQSQYFPLVYSTLRLEYALWGLQPLGYHLVNVGVHIVNALLVWTLLRRLALPGAWLAAAVFALHPVQVETVAWVTELKNTESTLFYLLAVMAWLNFCNGRSRWFYGLAILLHALALFAKTTACTLPAVLLLVLWLKQQPVNGRRILQVAPFMAMGIAMGLLSIWWEKHLGNYAPKIPLAGGPLERLLIATHAAWFYAWKLIWPVNLTFSYPRWVINAGDPAQYLWLVAWLLAVAGLWHWWRTCGRGTPAAVFFFVAVLSPMLGFIPLYTFYFSFVADHYQYLACLGLIALGAAGVARYLEKWPARQSAVWVAAFLLLFSLASLTFRQSSHYHSLETLWADTLEKNPRSWMAHTNLGRLQAQAGDFTGAETNYLTALQINPDDEDIHYNYANLLTRTRRLDAAVAQYELALELNPAKPDPHNNFSVALLKLHRWDDAIAQARQAVELQPDSVMYHFNLANALDCDKKTAEAVAEFQRALQLQPDSDLIKRRLQALGVTVN